jgi:hypothetical protein
MAQNKSPLLNSWGPLGNLTKENIDKLSNLPYGGFKQYLIKAGIKKVRKSSLSKSEPEPLKLYKVRMNRVRCIRQTRTEIISAITKDQAYSLAKLRINYEDGDWKNPENPGWQDLNDPEEKNYKFFEILTEELKEPTNV